MFVFLNSLFMLVSNGFTSCTLQSGFEFSRYRYDQEHVSFEAIDGYYELRMKAMI